MNMLTTFRKYQTFHSFKKFIKLSSWEKQLQDQGRIDGAYLIIKRFKNRLKQFDQALEKLYENKASKEEFEKLC